MYQSITIVGRVGQDPELRHTQSGAQVVSLSVAVSDRWTAKDGQKSERTDWFRVTAWQKLAEICGKYLKKGSLVMFVGKMQQSSYEKDGQEVYQWTLVASEMKMLESKRENTSSAIGSYSGASNAYASYDPPPSEDVPF